MTENKTINTTIEILGKPYSIRCLESEAESLTQAAQYLNDQMTKIQASGKAINVERIAIMAALNISHQFLQHSTQKESWVNKINNHITTLQNKIEQALGKPQLQTELFYSTE